ncbi:MAG TPA: hypothetical protein PLQ93_01645 [Bacteroidia bacterium]|nr:hypothetical protein [Bacteroidia bacterium]
MKDVFWTLLFIWLIYKISALFRQKKSQTYSSDKPYQAAEREEKTPSKIKPLDKVGEYVEYEDLKP